MRQPIRALAPQRRANSKPYPYVLRSLKYQAQWRNRLLISDTKPRKHAHLSKISQGVRAHEEVAGCTIPRQSEAILTCQVRHASQAITLRATLRSDTLFLACLLAINDSAPPLNEWQAPYPCRHRHSTCLVYSAGARHMLPTRTACLLACLRLPALQAGDVAAAAAAGPEAGPATRTPCACPTCQRQLPSPLAVK
jgi:hypothetical protein